MNPDLRAASGDATRVLLDGGPKLVLWWWAGLVVVFAGLTVARNAWATVDTSTWQWAETAPKVLVLIVGGALASMLLPTYVGHGITRRAFSLAAGAVIALLSVSGAALMAGGYAIEAVVYDAQGWPQVINEPHLYASAGQWYLIVVEFALAFMAWAASGWLAGAGYYRWDWWRGTLFCVPAALPLVAAEGLVAWYARGHVGLTLAIAGLVAVAIVGAITAYHFSKDMPLRAGAGWAT